MSDDFDKREWITVFPDYPRAFAWVRHTCSEAELDSYVGGCCGDLYSQECRGDFMHEELPKPLVERFCSWMDKWDELDMSERRSDDESNPTEEELAIDNEGVELTKELKKLYGDKYRFRYSFAWRHSGRSWVVV